MTKTTFGTLRPKFMVPSYHSLLKNSKFAKNLLYSNIPANGAVSGAVFTHNDTYRSLFFSQDPISKKSPSDLDPRIISRSQLCGLVPLNSSKTSQSQIRSKNRVCAYNLKSQSK